MAIPSATRPHPSIAIVRTIYLRCRVAFAVESLIVLIGFVSSFRLHKIIVRKRVLLNWKICMSCPSTSPSRVASVRPLPHGSAVRAWPHGLLIFHWLMKKNASAQLLNSSLNKQRLLNAKFLSIQKYVHI